MLAQALGWAGLREQARREARGPVSKKTLFIYIFNSKFLLNRPKFKLVENDIFKT
jgi:hypothetical protein